MSTRSGRCSLLASILFTAAPAGAALDLVGLERATFTWQPASGPTAGAYENQSAVFSLSVSYHR